MSTGSNIMPLLPLELCGIARSREPFASCSAIQAQSFSSSFESSALKGISGTLRSRKMMLRCMFPAFGAAVHS